MKTQRVLSIALLAVAVSLSGCEDKSSPASPAGEHAKGDGHDHKEGDGHDHEVKKDDDKEGDGHDHEKGDGHDHK